MGVDVLIRDGSEWMWRHLTSFSRFLPLIRTYRSASSQSQGDGWDWMDESNGEECGGDTGRGGEGLRCVLLVLFLFLHLMIVTGWSRPCALRYP